MGGAKETVADSFEGCSDDRCTAAAKPRRGEDRSVRHWEQTDRIRG